MKKLVVIGIVSLMFGIGLGGVNYIAHYESKCETTIEAYGVDYYSKTHKCSHRLHTSRISGNFLLCECPGKEFKF